MGAVYVMLVSYETPPPFLCQDLGASEEVEGQLPEQGICGIDDQLGESGPMGVMMEMADTEVLFHNVADFGDSLVPFFFVGSQPSASCRLSHDAVLDLVKTEELPVFLSKVALVGKDLLDRILGMTTSGDTEGEIGAVMERSRGHFRGEDKTISGIHRSVLFQSKVRLVVFDRPVGIEISGELRRFSQLIQAALRCFSFSPFFPQFVFADGTAGRFYQAGIDGHAFIDG